MRKRGAQTATTQMGRMGAEDPSTSRGGDLHIRPVRPGDRDRVVELTKDVWGGHDYLPEVFDEWVADAASAFEAIEVDGTVVGLQRLRPYAPGLVWYEGLRVAASHRRQGLARAMLMSAIAEAKEQGFREMRLATGNLDAVRLFESVGFRRLLDVRWWRGPRVEGGESPRIPPPAEAEKLWPMVAASPGVELYGGVAADFNGARDISAAAFIAGQGGSLRELLMALRFEADADGLDEVVVGLPRDHPAGDDLLASGYDFANDDDHTFIYALTL